jgi:hypothetical protein
MKLTTQSLLVWTALAATVAAAVFAPKEMSGSNTVAVVADSGKRSHGPLFEEPVKTDPDTVLELKPRDTGNTPIGSFSSTIWPAPRPVSVHREVPPPAAPPPAPTAPPLPFRVVGRYIAKGQPTVFMQYNDRTVLATHGMVIDDQYRVDSISETEIALIYLPLNERQTLTLASGK